MISLFIDGIPVPQGRPRARGYVVGGKTCITMYDPPKSKTWKGVVAAQARVHAISNKSAMLEGCIAADFIFFMPRPKSKSKKIRYCCTKPDVDNLVKGVKDALEGIFYKNDSQICRLSAVKMYSDNPGVSIVLSQINEEGTVNGNEA